MKKRAGFRHLTDHDRDRIQALRESGHTQKDIARVLFVTKGTVSRELKRNPTRVGRYVAVRAQENADEKRSHSKRPGMKIEANPELRRYIIQQLMNLRSPDEIAGRMKRVGATPRVGTNAIYKWLYAPAGKRYCRYLCTRRPSKKRQKRAAKKVLIPDRISLHDRPDTPGLVHAQSDLFVSPTRLHDTACGLVVVVPAVLLLARERTTTSGRKSTTAPIPRFPHISLRATSSR
jgi:IS30 family transposase